MKTTPNPILEEEEEKKSTKYKDSTRDHDHIILILRWLRKMKNGQSIEFKLVKSCARML